MEFGKEPVRTFEKKQKEVIYTRRDYEVQMREDVIYRSRQMWPEQNVTNIGILLNLE